MSESTAAERPVAKMALAINPAATITWQPIDDFGSHAMIVDNFLVSPDALRATALGLAFQIPSGADRYPGLKSYVALPGGAAVKAWIAERILAHRFTTEPRPAFRVDDYDDYGGFSVFACDRDHPILDIEDQHTDDMAWLAAVVHLSTVVGGRGTAMWEHRPTGLQQWLAADPVRLATLARTFGLRLDEQIARAVERYPGFISATDVPRLLRMRADKPRRLFSNAEDAIWRRTAYVPARWNRLVVYPTWQIHSVVDESPIEWPTVDDARLTYNLMIDYPFAREQTRARPPYPRAFYRRIPGLSE